MHLASKRGWHLLEEASIWSNTVHIYAHVAACVIAVAAYVIVVWQWFNLQVHVTDEGEKKQTDLCVEQLPTNEGEHQKNNLQLQQQIKMLQERIEQQEKVKQELKEKEGICQRISHDLEVLRQETDREVAEKNELLAKKDIELADKVRSMTEEHEAACKEIQKDHEAKLSEVQESLQSTIAKKDGELTTLQEHKQTMEEELTKLKEHHKKQVEDIEEELRQLQQEKDQQLKDLETEKLMLQKRESELQQKHDQAVLQSSKEIVRLKLEGNKIEQVQKERDEHLKAIEQLRQEKGEMVQQQEKKEATWQEQEAQMQTQLEAMKEEKKRHETEVAELLATHQQAMDGVKKEIQILQKTNSEKDARLLQLEQQQSSEMEVCRQEW